jgi:4-hydroxy-3-methylbut-2-enyl diphosphate reductase
VTQTTLSVEDTQAVIDALRERFPAIQGPKHDDICYATQNRQDAVKELAQQVGAVLVVGSVNSSNSNRLREIAEKQGVSAYLIDGAEDINSEWLAGLTRVGVTAGASAPESLVQGVVGRLRDLGGAEVRELRGIPETIEFALPKELRVIVQG